MNDYLHVDGNKHPWQQQGPQAQAGELFFIN